MTNIVDLFFNYKQTKYIRSDKSCRDLGLRDAPRDAQTHSFLGYMIYIVNHEFECIHALALPAPSPQIRQNSLCLAKKNWEGFKIPILSSTLSTFLQFIHKFCVWITFPRTECRARAKGDVSLLLLLFLTRRYGPLRGPTSSSCGGLRPRLFFPFGQKKGAYYAVLVNFWQLLVPSSNLGNFE